MHGADFLPGYHGDLNETYPVGEIDEDSKKLLKTTRLGLDESIKICKPGALFRDIGKAMCVLLWFQLNHSEGNMTD